MCSDSILRDVWLCRGICANMGMGLMAIAFQKGVKSQTGVYALSAVAVTVFWKSLWKAASPYSKPLSVRKEILLGGCGLWKTTVRYYLLFVNLFYVWVSNGASGGSWHDALFSFLTFSLLCRKRISAAWISILPSVCWAFF